MPTSIKPSLEKQMLNRVEIEERLNQIWYGSAPPALWLKLLTPLYWVATRIDRWWKLRHRCEDLSGKCIIVVGNITAGGSGKTPLVIRLCRLAAGAGLKPGVISRGYGRTEQGLRAVNAGSSPDAVGDEPILIAHRAGVPVIVAADRCEAARALSAQGVNVIICDDGLQHYRLPRSMEICVIDGSRGFGNGRLIPAGPLREPVSRLASVDHVVMNGEFDALPGSITAHTMHFVTGMLRSLDDGMAWRLAQFKGCKVHAVAGIGNPKRFFDLLRNSGISVLEHAFPDHHSFRKEDFEQLDEDFPILMTEKDAVKCTRLDLKNAWFLSVDAVLPAEWENALVEQMIRQVNDQESIH
jgi:tetraacyldisaccharide 4'-kinase